MKLSKLKLESKYILGIFAIGIGCFILLGCLIYRQVSIMLINQCKEDAMGLAQVASRHIDGDEFDSISSENDSAHAEVYATLERYRDNNLITYIYAMRKVGDHLEFVVDTDKDEPAAYGEPYELLDSMLPAFNGKLCADSELTTDKWGAYFSAYAPIFNSSKEVVGIIGADILLGDIQIMLSHLRILIIIFLSLFAVGLLVTYIHISEEIRMRDSITELPNVDKLIMVANRLKKKDKLKLYTGIHFNIKDFKYINQQIGTDNGDSFLRKYAHLIRSHITQKEMVVSMGGDSFFALILKERAEDFLSKISPVDLFDIMPAVINPTNPILITVRVGVYSIEKDSIREIMNNCSLAYAEAKESGTDIVWFKASMMEEMLHEKNTLAAYVEALRNEEFCVYYQPKVSSRTGNLSGAEALCRWIKDGKLVPPNSFIPVLEKHGKVEELDFYIFEHVCRDIRKWLDKGITPVRISSNFSKKHLDDPNFSKKIMEVVHKYDIPTEYIETELTESSGYSDHDALVRFLTDMKNENIHTSMDDFGTGYSSLSLLKSLPFNIIKIDKSFFDDMDFEHPETLKMIEHLIRMIHDLNRSVVCEGIETKEQVEILRTMDFPLIQGYFFDKPLPSREFEKRLLNPTYM